MTTTVPQLPTSLIPPLLTYEVLLPATREVIEQHARTPDYCRELRGGAVLVVEVVRLSRGPIVAQVARQLAMAAPPDKITLVLPVGQATPVDSVPSSPNGNLRWGTQSVSGC